MLMKLILIVCLALVANGVVGFRKHRFRHEPYGDNDRDSHEYEHIKNSNENNNYKQDIDNNNRYVRDEIYEPCHLDDIKCIRKEMAANSDCDPRVFNSVPDPVGVAHFKFEAPYFNSSFYDQYLMIRNLKKCFVSDYYTNLTSDTTIFAMDCPDITFEANRTVILHQESEEDILFRYQVFMVYHSLRIKINLRPSSSLDLCGTRAFSFISELKSLKLLPHDKATEEFIKCDQIGIFRKDRTIFDREVAYHAINMYIRLYINNLICNFGCKSLSEFE